jgi:hypothetical protein
MVDKDVFVTLSESVRVRHVAVTLAGVPLCGNHGEFPYYGRANWWSEIPWCSNCKVEARRIATVLEEK